MKLELSGHSFEKYSNIKHLSLSIGKHLLQYLSESIGRIYVDRSKKYFETL